MTLVDGPVTIPLEGGGVWEPGDVSGPSGRHMTLHDGLVSLRTSTELVSITGLLIVVHLPMLTRLLIDGDVSVEATLQSDSLDIVAAGKPALTLTGRARHLNLALGGNSKVVAKPAATRTPDEQRELFNVLRRVEPSAS